MSLAQGGAAGYFAYKLTHTHTFSTCLWASAPPHPPPPHMTHEVHSITVLL